jgi:hypothetical protein
VTPLDRVPTFDASERVYRITLSPRQQDRLRKIRDAVGSGPEFQEALDFVNAVPARLRATNLAALMRLPFERRPFRPTRFSNGDHGVLYTALMPETAGREYGHWAPVVFGAGMGSPFRVRLHLISCWFAGKAKDFRPHLADFPWLTADQDYGECQRLGAAAKAEGLAGFLAPSARQPNGTTVPILAPGSASQPRQEREVVYLIDPTAADGPMARIVV